MSASDVSPTIVPKSDQLNADDLLCGPITVTVESVKVDIGKKDQPVTIGIDGGRQPYKPCKSMRRVLAFAWGKDAALWVGRSMTLFCDPEVTWAGVKVGGIRISHLSHIESDRTLLLTTAKGKRGEFHVKRLVTQPATYPDDRFEQNLGAWKTALAEGKFTPDQLIAKAEKFGAMTEQQKARIYELANEALGDRQ